ncbi:MAG: hypothetical protein KY447_00140 [Actinobacteria bacterium]|nr:hypothetical protein [Actinomycetota bacterium]
MKGLRAGVVALGALFVVLLVAIVVRIVSVWVGSDVALPPEDDQGSSGAEANITVVDERELVQVVGLLESFARPDDPNTLGAVPSGPAWSNATGTWGIAGEQAYVASPSTGRNHAVVDLGQPGGAVEVKLNRLTEGAGLVFRFQDPENYWAVVAAPSYATWAVVKVVEGNEEVVGNTGLSPIANGTTIGVRMNDTTIEIVLDHRVVTNIADETLRAASNAGLTAQSMPGVDAASARFDDFVLGLPEGTETALPAPPPTTGTGTRRAR